jgi:hypothetical protein
MSNKRGTERLSQRFAESKQHLHSHMPTKRAPISGFSTIFSVLYGSISGRSARPARTGQGPGAGAAPGRDRPDTVGPVMGVPPGGTSTAAGTPSPGGACWPAPGAEPLEAVVEVQRLTETFSTPTGHCKSSRQRCYDFGGRLASAQVLAPAMRGQGGMETLGHYESRQLAEGCQPHPPKPRSLRPAA